MTARQKILLDLMNCQASLSLFSLVEVVRRKSVRTHFIDLLWAVGQNAHLLVRSVVGNTFHVHCTRIPNMAHDTRCLQIRKVVDASSSLMSHDPSALS